MSVQKKLRAAAQALGLVLTLVLTASLHAENARFLVKVKDPTVDSTPQATPLKHYFRNQSLNALKQDLVATSPDTLKVAVAPHFGMMVVEGERKNLERALSSHPLVKYFEKDVQWKTQAISDLNLTPAAEAMSPWISDVLGLDTSNPDPSVTYTGNSPVLVAVVDTGMTVGHPFLNPAASVNQNDNHNGYVDDVNGANVLSMNGDVSEEGTDHGSHVSGLVKAIRDQAIGSYPQAAAVELLPIRFIDETGAGSTSGAILGLEYAASRGARVVNASWGAGGVDSFSQALYDAMAELYQDHDMLITVAAGNAETSGPNDNDIVPYFPSSFNIPSLISVASITPMYQVDENGRYTLSTVALSDFSNYGAHSVNIAAPGDMQSSDFSAAGIYSANAHFTGTSDMYIQMRGTSMASPIVAGVAAVVRAINPSLTSYEVRQLILNNGKKSAALSAVTSSSWVDAASTFAAASAAASQGLKPTISGAAYTAAETATQTSDGSGGCGALLPHGASSGGSGPFGGNSLGLFAFSYLVLAFTRRLRRKSKIHRV